jgi:signal transduction histidine kinase
MQLGNLMFNSIGNKISASITVAIFLVTSLFSYINLTGELNRKQDELQHHGHTILALGAYAVSNLIWDYNSKDIRLVGESILQDKEVYAVEIKNVKNEHLFNQAKSDESMQTAGLVVLEKEIVGHDGNALSIGTIRISMSQQQYKAYLHHAVRTFITQTVILLFIMLILVVFITNIITKPLKRLTDVSEQLAHGNLEARSEINSSDEIGVLSDKFNLMTRNLIESKLMAEKANNVKSEFISNMNHEIRNPLNGIMGLCHLLSLQDLTERQKSYVDSITKCAQRLLQIVSDILDLSRIEAGKSEIETQPFNLNQLVDNVLKMFEAAAITKGITLKKNIPDDDGKFLLGDENKISQILTNIVGNAVKFTHDGYVKVSASLFSYCGNLFIRFTVEDTGIGISHDLKDSLFKPFVQGDASYSKRFEGTGLGLAISKKMVELLGGEIGFESNLNKGTSFFFTISVSKDEDRAEAQTSDMRLTQTSSPSRPEKRHKK